MLDIDLANVNTTRARILHATLGIIASDGVENSHL